MRVRSRKGTTAAQMPVLRRATSTVTVKTNGVGGARKKRSPGSPTILTIFLGNKV